MIDSGERFPQVGLQRNAVYGKLILRKIIEIVATICHISKLKCTKFDFDWGSALVGELTPLPDPIAGFKWPTSKGRNGSGERTGGKGKGGGEGMGGRGGERS